MSPESQPTRPPPPPRRRLPRRRASVYVLALGATMLVSVLGLTALLAARIQTRTGGDLEDAAEARLYAQSAIEMGLFWIADDVNWRNSRANGAWATNRAIGSGTFSLEVVNPYGALNRSASDPVILTGTGVKGNARHKTQVQLDVTAATLTCMTTALSSAGNINWTGGPTINATGLTIAGNANITSTNATVNGIVETVGTASGGTYSPTPRAVTAARTLPTTDLFQYYKDRGTWIPVTALPSVGGLRMISNRLLSPGQNPFPTTGGGVANAEGVYVIDCAGANVIISNSRIVGTLVLLNPGTGSAVQSGVNWAPAVRNYPCLLVQGNMTLKFTNTTFAEGANNLNPSHTPYPYSGGSSDNVAEAADTYPSVMQGYCYVSGNLSTSSSPTISGLFVGGTLTSLNTLTLNVDSYFASNPAPGFTATKATIAEGTWRQIVD